MNSMTLTVCLRFFVYLLTAVTVFLSLSFCIFVYRCLYFVLLAVHEKNTDIY